MTAFRNWAAYRERAGIIFTHPYPCTIDGKVFDLKPTPDGKFKLLRRDKTKKRRKAPKKNPRGGDCDKHNETSSDGDSGSKKPQSKSKPRPKQPYYRSATKAKTKFQPRGANK